MSEELRTKAEEKPKQSILSSIHYHLSEPELNQDSGQVKLIDHDENCLYFGLYEANETTGLLNSTPTVICTVEVSSNDAGGR